MVSFLKSGRAKRLVAPTVGNPPIRATVIIAADSRIFPGKGFPFEFVSKPAVFDAAIPNVGANYL